MVLAAENDETRQTVSFLIVCLVGIAIALAVLTVWYWFHTDPKRRREAASASLDGSEILDAPEVSIAPDPTHDAADAGGEVTDGRPLDARSTDGVEDVAAELDQDDEFVTGPLMARQTWDFVAAAKRAEDGGDRALPPPAAPRIAVPQRSGVAVVKADEADELAVVRRRREQEAARGLSDEVWESVRRSVFDKLDS